MLLVQVRPALCKAALPQLHKSLSRAEQPSLDRMLDHQIAASTAAAARAAIAAARVCAAVHRRRAAARATAALGVLGLALTSRTIKLKSLETCCAVQPVTGLHVMIVVIRFVDAGVPSSGTKW